MSLFPASRACLVIGIAAVAGIPLSVIPDSVIGHDAKNHAAESGWPAEVAYPVGQDIMVLVANPWHGNGNIQAHDEKGKHVKSKNGLGHHDNQYFYNYVVSPQADPSNGWTPCANRVHLISVDSGYNNATHFIENQHEIANAPGLWVAYSFHVRMRQQEIWLWNGNPDSVGDRGDIQWRYRIVTAYYKVPASGNADKLIIQCKHEATKAATEQAPPIRPGELVGPQGDDDNPIVY